jgi:hypothetical protein
VAAMAKKPTFKDFYSFPGFRARASVRLHPRDPGVYIVRLERRQKKQSAPAVAEGCPAIGIAGLTWCGIWMPALPASILSSPIGGLPARTAKP